MKALRHRHYQGFNDDEPGGLTGNSGEANSNSGLARGPKVITARTFRCNALASVDQGRLGLQPDASCGVNAGSDVIGKLDDFGAGATSTVGDR